MPVLTLTKSQNKALDALTGFLSSNIKHEFLLLGAAGSGKTTVIVNAFNTRPLSVAFCAFTNKATQVLKHISDKFNINFIADYMTIHSLLKLEAKYSDIEKEVIFTFDITKIANLKNYDVLIFDECSTISLELYDYIRQAQHHILANYGKQLKLIFLGDYWQIPPVGEDNSIIFQECKRHKWPIAKLTQVMRSNTIQMDTINANMLEKIASFKTENAANELHKFAKEYPYSAVPKELPDTYVNNTRMLDMFIDTWNNITSDTVILTYSRNNCEKINYEIQDMLDEQNNRPIPDNRSDIVFYPGDRCCIDRPYMLHKIVNCRGMAIPSGLPNQNSLPNLDTNLDPSLNTNLDTLNTNEKTFTLINDTNLTSNKDQIVKYTDPLDITLFNGEIFEVTDVVNVKVRTALNRFKYLSSPMPMQLLTVVRANDRQEKFQLMHCAKSVIDNARELLINNERRYVASNALRDFKALFPTIEYAYCMTIYKAQGSEWDTVFVNLNSIKWSILGKSHNIKDIKKYYQLVKTTYTAVTRASKKIICTWGWE